MYNIPKKYEKNVINITNALINYKNKQKLSWMESYKDVLKNMNLENKISDNKLLHYVVLKITEMKYDIVCEPYFKLKKY